MTFGVSVVSKEDENDDWVAIWKDEAVPAFALRNHGNSQKPYLTGILQVIVCTLLGVMS